MPPLPFTFSESAYLFFLTGTASKQAYFALHLQKTWQKIPFSSHTAPCGKCSSAFLVRASA